MCYNEITKENKEVIKMTDKFSWNNFSSSFIRAVVYSESTPESARPAVQTRERDLMLPSMNAICSYPTERFVMTYRHEIESVLMQSFPEQTNELAEVLSCRGNILRNTINYLSQQAFSRSVIKAYVIYLLKIGGVKSASYTYRFVNITDVDLENSTEGELSLHRYQAEAVSSLKTYFIEEDRKRGMLVLPTGSGKTRTAVYFLLRDMVSSGYQVVWLAHRYMLLEQAEQVFRDNAPLAKNEESGNKPMRIITVSGMHRSSHELSKKDSIKIIGVQSAVRNLDHLRSTLGSKVMVVIDEAHHSIAPSYKKIVDAIMKKRPDAKLLGLTATPVRMTESGSRELMNMFDNTIIYNQSMKNLISGGYLSEPECTRVHTKEDFESGLSEEEITFIKSRHDLPESLIERIAASSTRNKLIVNTYLKQREKYGKTLIFAMNIPHCQTLCEEFSKNGIECEYICSGKQENTEIIERFRNGKLQVLINVNIMTEGSDVPDINSVFLTRPTESEGLLMQMIGRGMRGTAAGGTKTVYIVDFYDLWDKFNKWLDPSFLLGTEIESEQPADAIHGGRQDVFRYTDEMCIDVYNSLKQRLVTAVEFVTLPAAWYSIDDSENEHRILVFDDQLAGYERMADDAERFKNAVIPTSEIIRKYFRGFVTLPSEQDIEAFAGALSRGEIPQRYLLSDREIIDPQCVSSEITEQELDFMSYAAEIYEKYPVTAKLFGSLAEYRRCIFEYLNDPDGKLKPKMKTVEIPYEKIPFDTTPFYDLDELVREVINEMFGGKYEGISSINWTDKPESKYFSVFYYADNHIMINCILNSRDVPKEAVKYVIYHEMLHLQYHNHGKLFREQEHKYPEYCKWDQFLDGTFQDFDIKEM